MDNAIRVQSNIFACPEFLSSVGSVDLVAHMHMDCSALDLFVGSEIIY